MNLDPDLKLPTDSSAAIVTSGVLGDRYIELQPGGDEQMLKSGDTDHLHRIGRHPRTPDRPIGLRHDQEEQARRGHRRPAASPQP